MELGSHTLSSNDRRALLAVCGVAFALRFAFISEVHPAPVSDFEWYYLHAAALLHGQGFTTNGYPTAFWPLGWPYFLAGVFAIFGTNVFVAEVTQAVLNSLTAGLVFLIAQRIAGTLAGIVSGMIYAILPSAVEWCAVLASEPLYTFLWALTTYIWLRVGHRQQAWFALSGVLIGAAALVRPTAIFLWGVLLIYLFFASSPRTLKSVLLPPLIVFVFAAATITPDLIRNYRVFHAFVLISNNGGPTLWSGNNPYYRPGDWSLHDDRLQKMTEDPRTELQAEQITTRMAIAYIKSHPGRIAALALPKLKALYGNDDDGPMEYAFETTRSMPLGRAVLIINRAVYYPVLLLALAGLILCVRSAWTPAGVHPGWMLVVLNILYNTLPFLILPAYDRYHFPSMPYFVVFAGIAVAVFLAQHA
ncbi:MAG TPA: glycosyltransferase family 39 protein [Candidatus Baltobacteraceae bacterium]|nr:glycosyltransferase family 39 protein [Candidatus Baltobacteraceae bacterium]